VTQPVSGSSTSYDPTPALGLLDSSVTSVTGQLAVLLLESDQNQQDSERQARDAARAECLAAGAREVQAMHEAADAIESGALVSALFTSAGGALQIGAAFSDSRVEAKTLDTSGGLLRDFAKPANAIIGESSAEHHKATAKEYEMAAEQARWAASDAQSNLDRSNRNSDKILDVVSSIQDQQHAATNALIGRI
jgi:hypothetical protein